ncbi:MAG TPA: hypothetical protein VFN40_03680, partial [Gemmatimonadales bacterium]|nr:hypothetical protein [Gemmatimonadales bacterium]
MPVPLACPRARGRRSGSALLLAAEFLLSAASAAAQSPGVLDVPPDSSRWVFEGRAGVAEFAGRRCIMLDGGAATLKDLALRDGVIDLDVATPATRGFFGVLFRTDSLNGEFVYLRQHKSGLPD